jgi:hypothetical protein
MEEDGDRTSVLVSTVRKLVMLHDSEEHLASYTEADPCSLE